ncbi:hypothetical protein J4466_04290 [Candidatus Pacearchaeota archaeon]|nr:hypothetical protein [Candidatus Pacearchaeota archaeon]
MKFRHDYSVKLLASLVNFRRHGYKKAVSLLDNISLSPQEREEIRNSLSKTEKLSRKNKSNGRPGFSWEFASCKIPVTYERFLKAGNYISAQIYVLSFPEHIREAAEVTLNPIDRSYLKALEYLLE